MCQLQMLTSKSIKQRGNTTMATNYKLAISDHRKTLGHAYFSPLEGEFHFYLPCVPNSVQLLKRSRELMMAQCPTGHFNLLDLETRLIEQGRADLVHSFAYKYSYHALKSYKAKGLPLTLLAKESTANTEFEHFNQTYTVLEYLIRIVRLPVKVVKDSEFFDCAIAEIKELLATGKIQSQLNLQEAFRAFELSALYPTKSPSIPEEVATLLGFDSALNLAREMKAHAA
jgi:hypothetical protein